MAHLPSIQTLRAFEAAGRLRSYSRAAEELGLTHGAISHRIRELEARMGERLFEREGNSMLPTPAGQELLASVRNGLRLLERAFAPRRMSGARPLVASVLPVLASCWLVPRLSDFRARHPDIEIELHVSTELARFGQDGVDVAVRYGPGGWPDVQSRRLGDEIVFPVCSPAYARRLSITKPEDLERCLLLRTPWQPWSPWLQAAGLAWDEPNDGPQYPDSSLLLRAAMAGEGVALSRRLLMADDLAAGRLCRPFDIQIDDPNAYYLVWPSASVRAAEIARLGDWLEQAMAREADLTSQR
jgi:LysR family transcriptional regulator, glycine cleavage system transcriptional activator